MRQAEKGGFPPGEVVRVRHNGISCWQVNLEAECVSIGSDCGRMPAGADPIPAHDQSDLVVQTAGQPKILFVVGSTFGFRNDVLNLQYQHRVSLVRQAVATTIARSQVNTRFDIFGDHLWESGLQWRDQATPNRLGKRLRLAQQSHFVVPH
jgi:hypothetical protein